MGLLGLLFIPTLSLAAQLFIFDRTDNLNCVAKQIEFPSKRETILFSVKQCPQNIVWNYQKKMIYYSLDGQSFSRPMGNSLVSPTPIMTLPAQGIALSQLKNTYRWNTGSKSMTKLVGTSAGYVQTKSKSRFVFATVLGDPPKATTPIVFCYNEGCNGATKLSENFAEELIISVQDDFALITSAYDQEDPKVYNGSGKLIYENHNASDAIWMKEIE